MLLGWLFCLPRPLFNVPYAVTLTDRNGQLLDIRLAADEQLRFPPSDSLPERLAACLVLYEDEHFYRHPGVNPVSLAKALWQDIQARRAVRGGSTLTMQVARLSGGLNSRSLWRKGLEILQATRLEVGHSKADILQLYLAHAPFGGNLVGAEAASWRLFGKTPQDLTWAQAATLAVLPTAPAKVHLNRNPTRLKQRRDFLLGKLRNRGQIDESTYRLSVLEPLPGKPYPLPHGAPHLVEEARTRHPQGARLETDIDPNIQKQIEAAAREHVQKLAPLGICQASVIVASTRTGRVVAWAGNISGCESSPGWVHLATAKRSYGSLLKPFLYAAALDRGLIAPNAWLEDVPRMYGSFAPKNYYNTYEGVVPASEALARSLNLPYVGLLERYGAARFLSEINKAGLKTLNRPASHYGLSLILGGGEATLFDLAGAYRNMGAHLLNEKPDGIQVLKGMQACSKTNSIASKQATWQAFEAMRDATRPDLDPAWAAFAARQRIAWKTGTSHGYKDAWAIGVTPEYTVAVWVGNADGEGRTGNTGIAAAAPLMLGLFSRLGTVGWFERPRGGFVKLGICPVTGWRAGTACGLARVDVVPASTGKSPVCPYHIPAFRDSSGQFRADSRCLPVSELRPYTILKMSPLQEWYARRSMPLPEALPWLPGCRTETEAWAGVGIVYPSPNARIVVPAAKEEVIFQASAEKGQSLIWHLDGVYAGATERDHRLGLRPGVGTHTLTVSDAEGNLRETRFTVAFEE